MRDMPGPFRGAVREAMPFYLVCDVSESMWSPEWRGTWGNALSPWQQMVKQLGSLIDHFEDDDTARDIVHLSVIEFADMASVVLPLTKCSDEPVITGLSQGSWTNYTAVWELLRDKVAQDIEQLQSDRYLVSRPTIYFITDANPGSEGKPQTRAEWGQPYDQLHEKLKPAHSPRVISLGFGSVDNRVLLELHSEFPHGAALKFSHAEGTTEVVQKVMEQLRKSMDKLVESGSLEFKTLDGVESLCHMDRH